MGGERKSVGRRRKLFGGKSCFNFKKGGKSLESKTGRGVSVLSWDIELLHNLFNLKIAVPCTLVSLLVYLFRHNLFSDTLELEDPDSYLSS